MRRTFLSITWTSGVTNEDAQMMVRAVEEIYRLLRPHFGKPGQFDPLPDLRVFGAWMLPSAPQGSAYANVDWFLKRSLDKSQTRLLASRYLETVYLEPWQGTTPHFDLMLTEKPLVDDRSSESPTPEVIGISQRGMVSLITSQPFDSITNPDLRRLALHHAVLHFFGRMLNTPRPTRHQHTLTHENGLYCTATCAMRFTDTPTLALSFAQQQMADGVIYCEACQKDMVAQITGYHYGLN
jgi:hypothetical protein